MTVQEEIRQIVGLSNALERSQTFHDLVRYLMNHREDLEAQPTPRMLLNFLILHFMQQAEKYTSIASESAKQLKGE